MSSNGCSTEAGYEGTLCIEGICQACAETIDCQGDSVYGGNFQCDDGACVSCQGLIGCGCNADGTCGAGECVAGTCTDCAAGEADCVCDNGQCALGLRCDDGDLCETCPAGEEGCPCDGGACGTDLECMSDVCVQPTCEVGTEGCPCDGDGSCGDDLWCGTDSLCNACSADGVDCACNIGIGCVGDLVCDDTSGSATCREPVACADIGCVTNQKCIEGSGGADAECLEDCEDGWLWNDDTDECVVDPGITCTDDGEAGGRGILDDCTGANRECVEADGTTPAACGDCLISFLLDEDTDACREPITCLEIVLTCDAEHRDCVEALVATAIDSNATASDDDALPEDEEDDDDADPDDNTTVIIEVTLDAYCGDCAGAYIEDADSTECVVADDANCANNDPKSLSDECLDQNRFCDDPADAPPSCAGCIPPFGENPATGDCEVPQSCNDLNCDALGRDCDDTAAFAECGDCYDGLKAVDEDSTASECMSYFRCEDLDCGDDYCIETDTVGVDATCQKSECDGSWALDVSEDTPVCKQCNGVCDKDGQTGRFWLNSRATGSCVCETMDDWYMDTTLSFTPQPCDADGDGWVRRAASNFAEHGDDAVRANFRCDVRQIDRITLQNEWDQRYEVRLCGDTNEPVGEDDSCAAPTPLEMYEPTLLDDPESALDSVLFPTWAQAGNGRQLRVEELNPLTKACVSEGGDFNANDIEDIQEAAEMNIPQGIVLDATQRWLLHFGYFVELHRSWYEDRPGEDYGTIVIAEKGRCPVSAAGGQDLPAAPVPLLYDDASGSDYWKECTRNRRASFDRDSVEPGHDFGRWMCDAVAGTCATPPPNGAQSAMIEPELGLCETTTPPADGEWRGMTHHSQFRCVALIAANATPEATWEVRLSDLYDETDKPSGDYQFNACSVACPSGVPDCSSVCPAEGGACSSSYKDTDDHDPYSPSIGCSTTLPTQAGTVGWIATRYIDEATGDTYQEGCIDEWKAWSYLCPGWDTSLPDDEQGVTGDGVSNDFGNLVCGCGQNYGGLACEIGCPSTLLSDGSSIDGALISADYSLAPRSGWWMCGGFASTSWETSDAEHGLAFVGDDADGAGTWVIEGQIRIAPRERTLLCQDDSNCTAGWSLR